MQEVRQRRLTPSFRLASPVRKLLTLSWTAALLPKHRFPVAALLPKHRFPVAALLPKHRFPVASSLTQPQTASSALKSGL